MVDLDSTDLELIRDGDVDLIVGIRFTYVTIPAGATILNARIEFHVDELDSVPTSLVFRGEATDHAVPASISGNISGRSLTTAGVNWPNIPACQFYNADGVLIDDYVVTKNCAALSGTPSATATVPAAPSSATLALRAGLLYITEEK